jgi:tetratricopeptide (TPR) repeat protein
MPKANYWRGRSAVILTLMLAAFGFGCHRSPADRSARFIDAGKALMNKKDFSRALLQFQNAIKASPKNAAAYYQASLTYLQLGDTNNSISALNKALQLNPKYTAARVQMAELMISTKNPDLFKEARSRLEAALQDAPTDPYALQALALTDLQLGDTREASRHLEQALLAAPQELSLAGTLAETKILQNDMKGAEEVLRKAAENSPQSAEAQTLIARFYAFQNKFPEADQYFQKALALDRNYGPALLGLAKEQYLSGRPSDAEQNFKRLSTLSDSDFNHYYALFLFQLGRRDEAVRELERLWRQAPQDRMARTRLLAAYQAVNRVPDATKLLDSELKKNPRDLDALLERAELFTASRDYTAAQADLNKVLQLKPDSAELHYALARLNQAAGRLGEQRQSLYEALKLNPFLLPARLDLAQNLMQSRAYKVALDVLDQVPESQRPQVQTMRNWVLWSLGNTQEMRQKVNEALAGNRTPDLLVQDGLLKLKQGDSAGARASLLEALKINPADLRALLALTRSYVAEKQPSVAVQKVAEYAAAQPRSAPVQEFAGLLLWSNGDMQRARQAFMAAKAADPHFVNADFSLAQLDVLDKKWDTAEKRLQDIVRQDAHNARAMLWLANLRAAQGDNNTALNYYRQVADIDPANPDALNNMAYLLAAMPNHSDEALKYAQKAQEVSPDDPNIADTLGWILYQKGLYPSAIQQLQRAAAKESNVVWKYHLAMAYAKAGDRTHGLMALDAALKRDSRVPEAAQAKQLLDAK